tara:strand:+ start:2563 stop:3168 length:606 start_codon:yes stop_codon:yes gene_type:complete
MKKHTIVLLMAIMAFTACTNAQKTKAADTTTEEPTITDFKIGEKWTWKWKRSVEGEIRAEGEDSQEVVAFNDVLGFDNGVDTLKISATLGQKQSDTPFYDWPLKVDKKWKFEVEWENNEGTKGKTSQDVSVISFNEVTVAAGKFMAYKIVYTGRITNSRGYNAKIEDIWWYAPSVKKYIKHTQNDGEGLYINELIHYSSAQ